MTEFSRSNWANPEFSQGYRDNADIFIVERRRMLTILRSFYLHFLKDGTRKTMLDLGCGDGIVTSAIADVDDSISPTLVDGSKDMLMKARERLDGLTTARYIQAGFQEMLQQDMLDQTFDFAASSLAIHHLTMDEKTALFKKVHTHLNPAGYFVNIDVILAPSESLEQWYLSLWKDWIDEQRTARGIASNQFDDIIQRYKDEKENKPDTIDDQLQALRNIGYQDVDCYYRYGIFTIFGGRK